MEHLSAVLASVVDAHPSRSRVPAVSVAVLAHGALATAARGAGDGTAFQAASISKPVAAVTALRLVARGDVALDADVNDHLRSWRLPATNRWAGRVTLRHLLCHGGALTMSGYPGYAPDAALPTLTDILDGRPPANTAPVRIDGIPGLTQRYSGGGYVILQQLLEDVTGVPYADLATDLVLTPAGMATAGFSAPAGAAVAHVSGAAVAGGWRVYPEQATAGLWCTPSDLVRFAAAIQTGAVLPPDLTADLLTEQLPGWGLGVQLQHGRFSHGGSNHGYQCGVVATIRPGHAVAVMTNSDDGGPVARALIEAAAAATDWPDPPTFPPDRTDPAGTADAVEARYVGDYRTDTGVTLSITTADRDWFLRVPGQPAVAVDQQGPTRALLPAVGAALTFTLDDDGRATALTLHQYGTEITARRV